ncbi:MAG: hypothetical protein Q7R76_05960 [Candidatus Woesearchaeota archaeon]|nr:hypothetical protein [Candidatus Woesearchaeota archaeon]
MIHAIKKYIKQELKKGYSLPIVKEELKHKGFSDDEIASALYETTTPRISFLHLLVLILGLVTLDSILGTVFLAVPLGMVSVIGRYLILFLIPLLLGLLNYWIIGQAVVDDLEKNLAGIVTPLPLVFLLHNFLSFNNLLVPLGAGIAALWYAAAHLIPFIIENIEEKDHPWVWLVLAAACIGVTLLATQLINVFAFVRFN